MSALDLHPQAIDLGIAVATLALLVAATVTDWRTRRIPNWLTLPLLAGAPLLLYATGREIDALWALGAAVACAVVPAVLWTRGAAGAGDIKLCAALGALAGLLPGLQAQLVAFAIVAAWSAVRHARRRSTADLPFAPALLVGTLSTLVVPL